MVCLWEMREMERGWGGWGARWGQAKEPASQCARVCRNGPLANCPLASPRTKSIAPCILQESPLQLAGQKAENAD